MKPGRGTTWLGFSTTSEFLLKVQTPEIHRSLLKLKPQFPSRPAFMSSPNQNRFASILIDEIDQQQPLPHGKTLRNHREASFRAGVHCVALCAHRAARLRPFHRHGHSRIYARTRPVILRSRFKAEHVSYAHSCLPCVCRFASDPAIRPRFLKDECRSKRLSQNAQKQHYPKDYGARWARSMGLRT
jgi:hypothetical protein